MESPKAPIVGHETENIVIKSGDVDKGIVTTINWLNSLDGVTTQYSCEGEPGENACSKPYVLFTCWDILSLMTILKETRTVAICEVTWYEDNMQIRYWLKFQSKAKLNQFQEILKRK